MQLTGKVDASPFRKWMARTAAATGKTIGELLPQQMGLLAKDMVAATPPFAGGFDTRAQNSLDKRVGGGAVARDIRKVFATTADLFEDAANAASGDPDQPPEDAAKAAVKLAKQGKSAELRALLGRLGLTKYDQAAGTLASDPDPALHRRHRKSRGRVYISKPRAIVTRPSSLNRYIRKKQGLVGLHKKGWVSGQGGGKFAPKGVPAWVRRQNTRPVLRDRTGHKKDPSVTLGNTAPGIADLNARLPIVRAALANRSRKLKNALKAKMRGAWKR